MLDGEHLAGAPEPGDHLVADEERAQLVGQLAEQLQIARGRHHVARGSLDRLNDDGRDVLRRLEVDLPAEELDAVPLARGKRLVERTARARRVRGEIRARREWAERVFEARPEQRKNAAGLSVEPAPETDRFRVPG